MGVLRGCMERGVVGLVAPFTSAPRLINIVVIMYIRGYDRVYDRMCAVPAQCSAQWLRGREPLLVLPAAATGPQLVPYASVLPPRVQEASSR